MKIVLLFAALLFLAPVRGDTIYFRKGGSTNGRVESMRDGTLYIRTSPEVEKPYKLADIEKINFNGNYTNSGPPPKEFNAGYSKQALPDSIRPTAPAAPAVSDSLILLGGQRKSCTLVSIDKDFVHCADQRGKDAQYKRQPEVMGIEVAPRP